MAQIDFYILDQGTQHEANLLACRLLEKAYQANQAVYVHMPSSESAKQLDALLWTYRDDSFIPHALVDEEKEADILIRIGYADLDAPYLNTMASNGLLLNLTAETPGFYHHFPRMMEIIQQDASLQQLARERYKHYRDQGHQLNTHKIKAK